ncbi:MAG: HK97 gp10 family phage protein [Negativicutes bacterium]|nr:HK97 gp10 family phage protein [Negativicutes bacterium]
MAFGDGLRDMVTRYKGYQKELTAAVPQQLRLTTFFIIARAKALTPPTDAEGYNANAVGDLKAHWDSDSIATVVSTGDAHTTVVANNLQYASYVENGHRMDQHFVPGLFIVDGQLVYDASMASVGGITVGTKTKYVRGIYMLEQAMREGESHLQQGMRRVLLAAMKGGG